MRIYRTDSGKEYTSFLECIGAENLKRVDLNQFSIIEFLTFGCVYGDKTFFNHISKKTTHQLYRLGESGQLKRYSFQNENLLVTSDQLQADDAKKLFLEFFQARADWLKSQKLSLDLTGGIDSRLIAAVLVKLEIPFEAVFSLGSGNEQELEIVKTLAEKENIELKIITPSQSYSSGEEIDELIKLGDGQWDPNGLKSLRRTQEWREKQEYDLAITGVGGELYKDFWWQQDFPLYKASKANIDRLLKMRMYPSAIPDAWLGDVLEITQTDYLKRFKSHLESFAQEINTKTYDQIYYNLRTKEQVSVFSHASSTYLPVWSPLLEPDLLLIGYNLRRSDRFFNRFHRDVISHCAPSLADLPTTDGGMSVSNRPSRVVSDLVTYARTKSERLLSKVGAINKNKDKSGSKDVIMLNAVQQAVEKLKKARLLSVKAPINPMHYSTSLQGRLILLGFLIEKVSLEEK